MKIISDLYKGFGAKILDNIPDILLVDIWNGQTEPFFGEENQIPLPACFIDMRATEIETIGENNQALRMRVTFHTAVDSLQDTRITRNTEYTISKIHDIATKLNQLFQGYKGEFFQSSMMRKAIYPYEAQTNVLQIAQEYEFWVIDDSAVKQYETATPVTGPVIQTGAKNKIIDNSFKIDY